ncbi:hypothetical protein GQ607_014736 [Colletotrichum asianum]|uniref:Uncharacterized protein n=1 Tax=Colletotrichum asianum TaxID=702518 RepID=A0A8H3ZFR4_9PEZI|nr:hypothetical protein GQ607_014736 [Colletotrichum asianum]
MTIILLFVNSRAESVANSSEARNGSNCTSEESRFEAAIAALEASAALDTNNVDGEEQEPESKYLSGNNFKLDNDAFALDQRVTGNASVSASTETTAVIANTTGEGQLPEQAQPSGTPLSKESYDSNQQQHTGTEPQHDESGPTPKVVDTAQARQKRPPPSPSPINIPAPSKLVPLGAFTERARVEMDLVHDRVQLLQQTTGLRTNLLSQLVDLVLTCKRAHARKGLCKQDGGASDPPQQPSSHPNICDYLWTLCTCVFGVFPVSAANFVKSGSLTDRHRPRERPRQST